MEDLTDITQTEWLQKEIHLSRSLLACWDRIPLLNITEGGCAPNNRLVKFRGMVQDILNPEYYQEQYEVLNTVTNERKLKTAKYFDILSNEENETYVPDGSNILRERQTIVVITPPGLNTWVRCLEYDYGVPVRTLDLPTKSQKRTVEDAEMDCGSAESKKLCTATIPNQEMRLCSDRLSTPSSKVQRYHAILYKDADKLKVTDLVEIVGFFSNKSNYVTDEDNKNHHQSHRIHCVSFKKIEHCNPLVYNTLLGQYQFKLYKSELHYIFTELLLGDELAAEYLIYHLMSKIYIRRELLPLGKFTLNISNIPTGVAPDLGKAVYDVMQTLVPTSQYVALTVDNLNTLSFIPSKNYETDQLARSVLQVPHNTHVVLDETKLNEGLLQAHGTDTLAALRNTIIFQQVNYNFKYFSLGFDCDIPFLILSEGRSLLPCDFHIRLQPDESHLNSYEQMKVEKRAIDDGNVNSFRVFFTQARYSNFDFSDDVMKAIQEDFVRMRQTQSISFDDLHQLLALSRLIALSDGEASLNLQSWTKACQLEEKRRSRIAELY